MESLCAAHCFRPGARRPAVLAGQLCPPCRHRAPAVLSTPPPGARTSPPADPGARIARQSRFHDLRDRVVRASPSRGGSHTAHRTSMQPPLSAPHQAQSEARAGGACTQSPAQQRTIDRGRSDLGAERQHGRCGRFSFVSAHEGCKAEPARARGGASSRRRFSHVRVRSSLTKDYIPNTGTKSCEIYRRLSLFLLLGQQLSDLMIKGQPAKGLGFNSHRGC